MPTTASTAFDSVRFRTLMSHWVTGVSLVTSHGSGGPVGCTANSLTSLSLDPPLLLVCFDQSARSLSTVRETRRLAINILAWDQRELSKRFASSESHAQKFRGISWHLLEGAPVIEGCLAHVVCGVEEEVHVGDHVIVVGRPVASGADETAAPLVFFRSSYDRMLGGQCPAGEGSAA